MPKLRVVFGLTLAVAVVAAAATTGQTSSHRATGSTKFDPNLRVLLQDRPGSPERPEDVNARDQWFYGQRSAPGKHIPALARLAAVRQAQAIPVLRGASWQPASGSSGAPNAAAAANTWKSLGPQPTFDDSAYNDASNGGTYGAGFYKTSGRVSALATNPRNQNVVYLGGADGGLWKSSDGGVSFKPIGNFDTQSMGAITVVPSHPQTVFVGTGEANTSSDSYWGGGVYRSLDAGKSFQRVGGSLFDKSTIFRIAVVHHLVTTVYAATDHGLFRSPDNGDTWALVLAPGTANGGTDLAGDVISDVAKIKLTNGKDILAVVGWRYGDASNGLWYSTDYGQTFANITSTAQSAGFAPQPNIGRVSLATTRADPNLIYATVQDAVCLSSPAGFCPPGTVWNGLYKSTTGPTGPWVKVADSSTFASDPNSAQNPAHIGPLYQPGIGSWYNQYVVIDPTNTNHVITGLEEIYQTTDGGTTWQTIGRYWDFCNDTGTTSWCNSDPPAPTTHPDQHAASFTVAPGGIPKLYVGSDGGVWSQTGATDDNDHWTNLNDSLSITQPYFAAASNGPNPTIYAGTQDNGSQKFDGTKWIEVFGGDGADVAVEPNDPNHTYEEYVYLAISISADGGHVWHAAGTPDSGSSSTARFIAPFDLDPLNAQRIVADGESVWVSTNGVNTQSADWSNVCDGTNACDQGSGHVGTALAVLGSTIYSGWCGKCNPTNPLDPSGGGFHSGLFSTVGGTWHAAAAAGLPNRYITSVTIDPANTSHIFATLSGFSRRWVQYAGTGSVFESTDGGANFTDISGNLPDDPANDTVLYNGRLIAATDVGVFERTSGTTWARLGLGMPNTSTLDLTMVPGSHTLLAATHGQGIYKLNL